MAVQASGILLSDITEPPLKLAQMFRATHTPPLSYLLDDLLTRDQRAIAKHLDVSPATLARWRKADAAPRPVMLALFYESRWGYSVLHTTATNGEDQARRHVDSLSREVAMLRTRPSWRLDC